VVRSAVPAIADAATLTLAGVDRQLRIVAVAHHDPERERLAWEEVRHHPLDPAANTGPARVIATGRPEVVDRHSITVPLASPAGVTGALSLVVGDSGRRFAPGDLDLVTSLANRAALHIQNARLYAEQAHIAATLQGSLRPRPLPDIPGADVAAGFLAAGELNEVGGDFYDVFPSGDDMWTAIVGDVSGKGPEAAAITALARHTLRTASMLHDDPAANLRLLDRALHAESAASDFCTVFYARICPGDGGIDLRFANGGHPSPMLLRVDGSVESVESGRGPLVGGVEDPSFTEATLHLVSGELLLIYTDGVTEVRTDDPELGVRELRRTLATHAGASAHEVVAAVGRRALELQEGDQRDDIALVAIRALP
jgi:serine phosphatase RsbU (regulator of sigma subunit)